MGADITDAKKAAHKTAISTQLSVHQSKISISYTGGSVVMTVTVMSDDASAAATVSSSMAGLTTATLSTALGETVTAVSEPTNSNPSPLNSDELSTGGIVGIAVGAGAAALLLLCVLYMIKKEKAGEPVFTSIAVKSVTGTAQARAGSSSNSAS